MMIESEINSVLGLYTKHKPNEQINPLQAIWHYTSIEGLMGIVGKGNRTLNFRFTRSDCLNDTSEGKLIIEMFHETCYELYSSGDINEAFWKITKEIHISPYHLISYPLPPLEGENGFGMVDAAPCEIYICCFSLKADSLDMWRYYSKGSGGYALKFLPHIFEKQQKYSILPYSENDIFYNIDSFQVIYDFETKKKILRGLIEDAYKLYRQHISNQQQEIEEMNKCIAGILQSYQYYFKHECFASEQEFRFICYRPTEKPECLSNALPEIHYRNQNGIVVPYIDIPIEKAHILEVMISPLIENTNCETITKEFLQNRGFKQCKVQKSQLPIRF